MSWQMCNRGFVETSSRININGVGDVFCWFDWVGGAWKRLLVMSRRGEEQAPLGRECKSAKKGGHGLVVVNVRILHGQSHGRVQAG